MIKLKNKSGDSKILSPWMIVILAIVGLIIAMGVWFFYSSGTDTRQEEAIALNNKIVMSIASNGHINQEIFDHNTIISNIAGLSDEVIRDSPDFYFNVSIYNETNSPIKTFVLGNPDFEFQCKLKGKYYAKCKDSTLVLLNKTNPEQRFRVKILTGVNQNGGLKR